MSAGKLREAGKSMETKKNLKSRGEGIMQIQINQVIKPTLIAVIQITIR